MNNSELLDYIKQARKIGRGDDEIKKELSKLAWKEGDIDEALNSSPKSLYTYKEENIDVAQNVERANIFSWRPNFTNFKKYIIAKEKYLIGAGLAVVLIFIGVGYSIIYLNNIKIREEAVAQSLQVLPEEQKDCVLDRVDFEFLEKIQDAQVFSQEYYKEQMELLGDCVLHKASPL